MTKKDQARLHRLEAENARLREQIEKHAVIYREQLYEIVELRTRLDLAREAMAEDGVAA